ncbi:MAG: DUF302 domain-containing protein [Myxococcales bacterium]|nr:DUF302 domain-containing protein [Myxococcales bacterium]
MTATTLRKTLDATYDEALIRVPEALKAEGFGVLTEIDVAATLKAKLNVDFRRYKILGACNPPFAHQALSADLDIGLMLPCNVVVYENDDGRAVVLAVDPLRSMAAADAPGLEDIAGAVRAKLERVLAQLT